MCTYKIVRHYFDRERAPARRVIVRGLALEQAQEWCRGTETSSRTCTTRAARNRTERYGPWFDGYDEE